MIRRLVVAAVIVFAGLSVAGCAAEKPITSGDVIGKEYDDPDLWYVQVTDTVYRCDPVLKTDFEGKVTLGTDCGYKYAGSHSEERRDGPHWRLKLRADEDADRTGWVEVTQADYDEVYQVGFHWPDLR